MASITTAIFYHLDEREKDPHKCVELMELIGMGNFGSVYRGIILDPNVSEKEVAVKVIQYNQDELHQLGRELYFLKNLNSPFIVHYIDSILTGSELWIAMELCDAGSLLDIQQATQTTFNEPCVRAVIACSLLGLVHIHSKRSIHRDIKAGNILLSSHGRAMLSDFGVSTQLTDDSSRRKTVIGTPYWMAPEILQEISYSENADVWSLGITLIECLEGQPPYYGIKPLRALFMISSKPAPILKESEKYSSNLTDFLSKCLTKNPKNRLQSSELLIHSWLQVEIHQLQSFTNNQPYLPILKELVKNSMTAVEDMRIALQRVTMSTKQSIFKSPETHNVPVTTNKTTIDIQDNTLGEKTNNANHNMAMQSRSDDLDATLPLSTTTTAAVDVNTTTGVSSGANSNNLMNYNNISNNDGGVHTRPPLAPVLSTKQTELIRSNTTVTDIDENEKNDKFDNNSGIYYDDVSSNDNGSNNNQLFSSVVRVMIPRPMSPFIHDNPNASSILYQSRNNHIHSSIHKNIAVRRSSFVPYQNNNIDSIHNANILVSSQNMVHLQQQQQQQYQQYRPSIIDRGSVIRTETPDKLSPRSANIELALKSFRNELDMGGVGGGGSNDLHSFSHDSDFSYMVQSTHVPSPSPYGVAPPLNNAISNSISDDNSNNNNNINSKSYINNPNTQTIYNHNPSTPSINNNNGRPARSQLMESKFQLYTQFLPILDPINTPPGFDIPGMSPERQDMYFKELSEIETQYVEDLKAVEDNYYRKKTELFRTYELHEEDNSG